MAWVKTEKAKILLLEVQKKEEISEASVEVFYQFVLQDHDLTTNRLFGELFLPFTSALSLLRTGIGPIFYMVTQFPRSINLKFSRRD